LANGDFRGLRTQSQRPPRQNLSVLRACLPMPYIGVRQVPPRSVTSVAD